MPHPLLVRVSETIRSHQLLPTGREQIHLAISGGADSVALLMALLALGYGAHLRLLHCDFALRGEESDGDEAFVRSLAEQHGLPYLVQHFDTRAYVAAHAGVSVEMAARELRYRWFASLRDQARVPTVTALAHNADDQIETLLLNLSMGTGIRGVSGMPYRRDTDGVIRPLMDCPRALVLDYLRSLGQPYREDSSNADLRYRRNLIRHRLIPLLEELNPSFRRAAERTLENLRGVETLYLERVEELRRDLLTERGQISVPGILGSSAPQTLLYELLHPYGFSRELVLQIHSQLREGTAGATFHSDGYTLVRGSEYLELRPRAEEVMAYRKTIDIAQGGELTLPSGSVLRWEVYPSPENHRSLLPLPPNEALYDYEALGVTELLIRRREEGDALYPYGMKGRKLLRRIFIDGKYSHRDRAEALLLVRGDQILWLIGHVPDRRYALSAETKQVLHLRLSSPLGEERDREKE